MRKKGKGAPPRKKKDRGYGMRELRMGIKPVRKNWEFDYSKSTKSQITRIRRFSDGRAFVDYPDGQKVIRLPDGTEIERNMLKRCP